MWVVWHWWYWLIILSGLPVGLGLGWICVKLLGEEE